MVGQHDAACTHADGRRPTRHVADQHCGGGAGDAGQSMVLGQPIAPVTPAFRMARQIERVAKRLRGVASLRDWGQVEDRIGNHCFHVGMRSTIDNRQVYQNLANRALR
jgi:hypothetical protein